MWNKRACLAGSLHLSLAGNVPLTGLYPAPRHSTPSQHDTPCHASQLVVVFVVYFTTLPVSRTTQRVVCNDTSNDKLKRIWKETVVVLSRHYPRICQE